MHHRQEESAVTSAAYLLFYRRSSEGTLGGPFFEQLAGSSPSASQADSRAPSPSAGEGKRLDDSSRNGLSSALHAAGAGPQAGDGGPAGQVVMADGDELPTYSSAVHNTRMDLDGVDEGIGMEDDESLGNGYSYGPHPSATWSFGSVKQRQHPPNNSDAEEDKESLEMGSNMSREENRMADFAEDEGTTMHPFGTPPTQATVEMEEWNRSPQFVDEPVVDIRIGEEDQDLGPSMEL